MATSRILEEGTVKFYLIQREGIKNRTKPPTDLIFIYQLVNTWERPFYLFYMNCPPIFAGNWY
jgi:hypothetical protein